MFSADPVYAVVLLIIVVISSIATWRTSANFLSIIALSSSMAGFGYVAQELWLNPLIDERWIQVLIRGLRMFAVYLLPVFLWFKLNPVEGKFSYNMGLNLPSEGKFAAVGLGLLLYMFALATFILWPPESCGFRFWENNLHRCSTATKIDWIITLPLLCCMAMLTDLWTRGFVLIQATERWGEVSGIAMQNLFWLLLHLYELEILAPSMSWPGAIILALILGILGDLIVLKWRCVIGLMGGHALLNIGWVLYLIM